MMFEEPMNEVYDYLKKNGKKTHREIINGVGKSNRVVKFRLARLEKQGLVKRLPNLYSPRDVFYKVVNRK